MGNHKVKKASSLEKQIKNQLQSFCDAAFALLPVYTLKFIGYCTSIATDGDGINSRLPPSELSKPEKNITYSC
jgi:hypothetical protein